MFKNGMGDNLVEVDLDTNEIFCPADMELLSLPFPVVSANCGPLPGLCEGLQAP